MSRQMPAQKRRKSKQDYQTPPEFIRAVERRFGPIWVDLAATLGNRVVNKDFISPEENSLTTNWAFKISDSAGWLNPPFGELTKWAEKCADEQPRLWPRGVILLLSPASVGANWFERYVWGRAEVYALKGRLTFVGETSPYPKDCMLSVYRSYPQQSFDVWDWRNDA